MNVGNALKLTCVGLAGGVVLRVIQQLYFYDYETNFYKDNGLMAWVCIGFVLLVCLGAGFLCVKSKRSFGAYVPRKNPVVGVVAILSGLGLLGSGAVQSLEYTNIVASQASSYESAERGVIHLIFIVGQILFGLVQIYASVGFFTGQNYFEKLPLLYLVSLIWGISYLVLVYVFYARTPSYPENLFAVLGAAFVLLALLYLSKLLAGVDVETASVRFFIFGIFAVVINLTYSLSNLLLLLLGKSYLGEIPTVIQASGLGISVFLLLFLITFRKYSLRKVKEGTEKPRHGGSRFAQ